MSVRPASLFRVRATGLAAFLAVLLAAFPVGTLASAAQADEIVARFTCRPETVELGEPFELVLEIEHPDAASVFDLGSTELALDPTWVFFGFEPAPRAPLEGRPGRAVTRRMWRVASLEPGPRSLAATLSALVLDERVSAVDASGATVEVTSVLGPDEDAPRPMRGFPQGFGRGVPPAEPHPGRWAAFGAAALLWAVVLWILLRRFLGSRPAKAPAVVPPLERLAALQANPASDPDAVRERHYELTHLVRSAADAELGAPARRSGMTDDEWLASLAPDVLPAGVNDDLIALFRESAEVKYGGALPTSWALEETYARARRALEAVRGAPERGADGQESRRDEWAAGGER